MVQPKNQKRKKRIQKIVNSYNEPVNVPAGAVKWDGAPLYGAGHAIPKVNGGGVLSPLGKVGVAHKPGNVANTVMNMLRNTSYVFKNGKLLNKYHKVGDFAGRQFCVWRACKTPFECGDVASFSCELEPDGSRRCDFAE